MPHHVFNLGLRTLGRQSLPPCMQRTSIPPRQSTQILGAPRLVTKPVDKQIVRPTAIRWERA